MFYLPHKEERFLFVIYPLICLCASISMILLVHLLVSILSALVRTKNDLEFILTFLQGSGERTRTFTKRIFIVTVVIVFVTLSASRAEKKKKNYGTASEVYKHLSSNELQNVPASETKDPINICVGKEWYRFPSNFFLPSERFQLRFVKSAFGGQLPQPFAKENGTSRIPTGFNNLNKEEIDRYVSFALSAPRALVLRTIF